MPKVACLEYACLSLLAALAPRLTRFLVSGDRILRSPYCDQLLRSLGVTTRLSHPTDTSKGSRGRRKNWYATKRRITLIGPGLLFMACSVRQDQGTLRISLEGPIRSRPVATGTTLRGLPPFPFLSMLFTSSTRTHTLHSKFEIDRIFALFPKHPATMGDDKSGSTHDYGSESLWMPFLRRI